MQKVLVSLLFFVGLMLILRSLLELLPKWRAKRYRKKKEREDNAVRGGDEL